jgi:exopolysaccharide production protein ExoY
MGLLHYKKVTVKRAFDLGLAFLGVILFSPVFLLCAILIFLESGRPIFFLQKRFGRNGKIFRIRKFRTMVCDAEKKIKNDTALNSHYQKNYKVPEESNSLITPFGKILRRTSMDELPQLFNVISGEMSLVGPRPVVLPEIVQYGDLKNKFLSVKPGLTGLWQVSGRNWVEYPERVDLDMSYIDNQSLWLDVKIISRTLKAVLEGSH